ncbi:hypothetical protein ACOSP7_002838 [Xanthoceras sorbifolium]
MDHFNISVKFQGSQLEIEKFKVEVRLPWNGAYQIISDDDELQEFFHMFREKKLYTIKVDVELLSLATMPSFKNQKMKILFPNQTFQLMLLTVKILYSQRSELLTNQVKKILKMNSFPMLPRMSTTVISLLRTTVKIRMDLAYLLRE